MTTGSVPEINMLVDIQLPDGRDFPSRIEDTDATVWTLAAPFGGGVEPPAPDSPVQVRWTTARGQYVAPTRLRAITHGEVTFWLLEPTGPVQVYQRRRFVRAGGGEPVSVRAAEAAGPETPAVVGRIVDISEGGVRCWLPPSNLATGDDVLVTVNLDDDRLTIPGTVLKAAERDGGTGLDLVVTFSLGEEIAGLVRRYVMRAQMQARRSAGASR